jgi:hypothetical protein
MLSDLSKCRDVGADDTATNEERFGDRQPKTFDNRGRNQDLAVPVAPLQLPFGKPLNEVYSLA